MDERLLAGLRILVVEDHDDSRTAIVKMLEHSGASVAAAADAVEALRIVDERLLDVIVSDINMPVHDGLWLIRELRSQPREPAVPAVAVTARVDAADRRMILAAGFQAHVPKPVNVDDLVDVIRRVVARSRTEC